MAQLVIGDGDLMQCILITFSVTLHKLHRVAYHIGAELRFECHPLADSGHHLGHCREEEEDSGTAAA